MATTVEQFDLGSRVEILRDGAWRRGQVGRVVEFVDFSLWWNPAAGQYEADYRLRIEFEDGERAVYRPGSVLLLRGANHE